MIPQSVCRCFHTCVVHVQFMWVTYNDSTMCRAGASPVHDARRQFLMTTNPTMCRTANTFAGVAVDAVRALPPRPRELGPSAVSTRWYRSTTGKTQMKSLAGLRIMVSVTDSKKKLRFTLLHCASLLCPAAVLLLLLLSVCGFVFDAPPPLPTCLPLR